MLRLGIALCLPAALALAQAFTFTIGSSVAAQDPRAKVAAFVFRTEGCADLANVQLSAAAEGLVRGSRRTENLKPTAMSKPGVYALYQNWPSEGAWVVTLKGMCGDARAGAIIPIGPNGFLRESARFFPRPATDSEIEASLKALAQGGRK